jgi:hypothetical protein
MLVTLGSKSREGIDVRIGYADPPYPGCAHLYKGHPDFAGEVDHAHLLHQLEENFDGWVLHTSSVALPRIAPLLPKEARIMPWVKPFAAFKRNIPVAYAWEPVIIKPARKPVVSKRISPLRDYISEPITMRRGLTGAKPEAVCHWVFECLGARPEDDLVDMFPGTGAVLEAWRTWRGKFVLPMDPRFDLRGLSHE